MENNPLVTVNILSYNRKDELRTTLLKVFDQDYKNIEVIVVDNASTDGSPEMVENEFPAVKLIKLRKNIGIAGWNEGFKLAEGEYVLVLDDDSFPEVGTIMGGLLDFSSDKKLGVVGFKIFNHALNIFENDELKFTDEKKYVLGFIGCGAILKKDLFFRVNGFNEHIFLFHHEYEYSARLTDLGYKILIDPRYLVHHQVDRPGVKTNILDRKRFYRYFLSYSVFLLDNFYYYISFFFIIKLVISYFLISIRLKYFKEYFCGLSHLPEIFFNSLSKKKLSIKTQKIYKYGNFKFFKITIY